MPSPFPIGHTVCEFGVRRAGDLIEVQFLDTDKDLAASVYLTLSTAQKLQEYLSDTLGTTT